MVKGLSRFYDRLEERVGILREFRIVTLVVLLFVGVILAYDLSNYIRNDALERMSQALAFAARANVGHHLEEIDFTTDKETGKLSFQSKERWEDLIHSSFLSKSSQQNFGGQAVYSIKVWNRESEIVFNTKGETGRFNNKDDKELINALEDNKISAGFSDGDKEDKNNKLAGGLVEVNVPIVLEGLKRPVGALQIYTPTNHIFSRTAWTILAIIILIFAGLLFLYINLNWFFARAHRRISQKNTELHNLTERVMSSLKELEDNYLGTIQALTMAVDAKDHYTAGHSFRVAGLATAIGKKLGLSEAALVNLERGARFHDIGKIGIKESILNKKGSLTEAEFKEMQRHAVIGAKILGSVKFLEDVSPIVRSHHERLDGSGYPDGLIDLTISLESKMVAVADVFDAMTSDRPNRKAFSTQKALEELEQGAGIKYSSEVVAALLEIYRGDASFYFKDDEDKISAMEIDDKSKSVRPLFKIRHNKESA